MKLFGLILGFDLLPILIALTYRDGRENLFIDLALKKNSVCFICLVEDCGSYENSTIRNRFGLFVGFGSAIDAEKDKCSMQISNPWSNDMQNGFGVFLPRSIDCSLNITIQCLPGSALVRQAESSTVEYTCRTSPDKVELSCSRIELIFTRNRTSESVKKFMGVQIVALAKGGFDVLWGREIWEWYFSFSTLSRWWNFVSMSGWLFEFMSWPKIAM